MAHDQPGAGLDIDRYIRVHEGKGMLRFITCGSVDDGKSTLIGRLLYETCLLFDDQLAAVEADSRKFGTQGDAIDLALLVDGLAAEREQGITIDVAYRYFSTTRRKFIVADTPGHEQYTRNMVTGASTAEAAIVIVDARKGVLTQTRRHSYLVSLLGIRKIVVAVNKMDLVGYAEDRFSQVVRDYRAFAARIGLDGVNFIPVSALCGDNVVEAGGNMPWYGGPSLLACLEEIPLDIDNLADTPFRFPVQWVNRPNPDFRGYAGMIAGGTVRPGDRILVQPSGSGSSVARIVTMEGDLEHAVAGQSVVLVLEDEVDVSRGDLISAAGAPAGCADQFEATLVWMHEDPLLPGRSYLVRIGAKSALATITDIKYQVNVNTLEHNAAKQLAINSIGVCNLSMDRMIAFDPYAANRDTGGFILIDRLSNHTVGAGMLHFALRRASNITLQRFDVDKSARAFLKGQKPCVVWLTGLSGAGKSTIANLLESQLHAMGRHTYLLDGDNVRHGLNRDLGFTDADRVENIRRVAEVAKLMADAGLIVVTAFISPFRSERRMARDLLPEGEFIEVFVDTPLEVAERRDPKGLYKKARRGDLKNFTGIDSPYDVPEAAEVTVRTSDLTAAGAADLLVEVLRRRGKIS